MQEQEVSRTALAVAHLRAAHQIFDAEPRIFDDPVAVPILGAAGRARLLAAAGRHAEEKRRALRSHVVLRARFVEDRLRLAAQRGVRQYVILGAGLDTFALRQPEWARGLRIVEIDHPATQAHKRRLLSESGLELPDNAALVPVDFERRNMAEALADGGVDPAAPAFFAWLGVVMYLPQPVVDEALRELARFPAGSEVVVSFRPPPQGENSDRDALARRVADLGEPFVNFHTAGAIIADLLRAGFGSAGTLGPEEAAAYYAGRPPDLPPPQARRLAWALR